MDPRMARRAAAGALIAGIGADVLFNGVALGINVPIATLATLGLVTWLSPSRRSADPLDLWLPLVALLASAGPAVRTDPSVVPLALGLIVLATGAWSVAVSGVAVTRRAASRVVLLAGQAGTIAVFAFAWLAARSGADGFFRRGLGGLGRLAPVARGAVIALPVLVGFSLLLASADAVFGHALDEALRLPIDLGDAVQHGVFVLFAAWLVAGPLALAAGARRSLARDDPEGGEAPVPPQPSAGDSAAGRRPARAGATEAMVVLVAVDLLFAAFAAVQVVYLFGGVDTLAVVGMSYSDYARQGYFQLVGVVALAGLLLLGAHEIVGRTRGFLIAALANLALTAVILASAALRLALYQGAYGWTELRFFVAASIAWLALCIALSVALLAADRMRWLLHGIAVSAVAVTLVITAIGPQAFVTRENLARVLDPSRVAPGGYAGFDVDYVLGLGDDAIPDLVASLAFLSPDDRAAVLHRLRIRQGQMGLDPSTTGPFAWNLARQRAWQALAELPGR